MNKSQQQIPDIYIIFIREIHVSVNTAIKDSAKSSSGNDNSEI